MAAMAQPGAAERGGGARVGGGGTTSRSLHNFSLPPRLSWGAHKLLRCSKSSPSPSSTSSQNDVVLQKPPSKRPRRTPSPHNAPFLSPPRRGPDDADQIHAVREQLMLDFRSEVDEMRATFLHAHPPPPPPPPPPTKSVAVGPRPWNLRTRRGDQMAMPSPVRVSEVASVVALPVRSGGNGEGEVERAKFSVALLRQDIEDDFMEMAGRRPPRKPKKRPRSVQKQLDTLFPGLWLSEITADMYKVNEIPEPPK